MEQTDLAREYSGCPNGDVVALHCTCTDCPLKNHCCACVAWHRDHRKKPLTHCLRDSAEAAWHRRA